MSAQPTRAAQRIAEIIMPEGIDRRGRPTRLKTCYGDKTREGIADLIDRETRTAELLALCEEALRALHEDDFPSLREKLRAAIAQAEAPP